MSDEPIIHINGQQLSPGQAATIRVALHHFNDDLSRENPLGSDEHGKEMTRLYEENINSVLALMHQG